ncbi:SDR family NAD(P)-dependent oxidoreductase [Stackebrandtia nassauensis]|uniref:Short-chain dehydrogenase/reductase SDR n=1 Tax=Stackebrandtia nassauensis (strain DSM 44728 / CIP 108903 / NRRL B-16338 / NBRC 102104 / LLR-40K-21) TaxID=446470 RepID=D3Q1N1_STANL|nr:glucose 1-dehydrogenase [Stackebrandtia nassauensis]ADD39879.1 short-chain dehydrogenase/reductase SDR [Stackebrandtia nassauensis DSM 44728]
MSTRFAGKTVLITGGGSGIGREAARAFAAEGATVVVAGRREAPLKETVELVTAEGGTASFVTGDVTNEEDVRRIVATVAERHSRLDVAVNNAGVFAAGPLAEFELDQWQRLVDINVTGVLLSMKHELRQLKQQDGGGAIINVGSTVGAHKSVPGLAAYGASKAAVSALSRAAAAENIRDGIRINIVSPGSSDTPMSMRGGETEQQRAERLHETVPLGRVGQLDEVVSAVLWLASEGSGFAVGHDLVVDGGVSL